MPQIKRAAAILQLQIEFIPPGLHGRDLLAGQWGMWIA
jgi:hypothetical protein